MYMCVMRSELAFIFTIFLLDFGTVLAVWYHLLFFLFQQRPVLCEGRHFIHMWKTLT